MLGLILHALFVACVFSELTVCKKRVSDQSPDLFSGPGVGLYCFQRILVGKKRLPQVAKELDVDNI